MAQEQAPQKLMLSLEQALEIALSENPTIKIADQQIEIKRYAKQGTYAALYPQIDATASYQRVIKKQTMSMDFGGQTQTIKVGSDNSFNGGIAMGMPVINAQLWESLKLSALDVELAVDTYNQLLLCSTNGDTDETYYVRLLKKCEEIKAAFEALLEEIEKAGSAIDAVGAELEMFDEERLTIFHEDEIEALKTKVDELLEDENMGEAETAKLNGYKAQCDNLIEIINTPAKYFSLRFFYLIFDAFNWLFNRIAAIF
jgi:hypothetical protein